MISQTICNEVTSQNLPLSSWRGAKQSTPLPTQTPQPTINLIDRWQSWQDLMEHFVVSSVLSSFLAILRKINIIHIYNKFLHTNTHKYTCKLVWAAHHFIILIIFDIWHLINVVHELFVIFYNSKNHYFFMKLVSKYNVDIAHANNLQLRQKYLSAIQSPFIKQTKTMSLITCSIQNSISTTNSLHEHQVKKWVRFMRWFSKRATLHRSNSPNHLLK